MLIESLRSCETIRNFIRDKCSEHSTAVEISTLIDSKDIVIIKPDDYYNSLNLKTRPASPDCLIVIRCKDGRYKLYIIELKDISNKDGFNKSNIKEKFSTCINNFISDLLRDYFFSDDVQISKLVLVFVTDPYGEAKSEEFKQLGKTTKIDALLALSAGEPFFFDGRKWCIQHARENPLIQPC